MAKWTKVENKRGIRKRATPATSKLRSRPNVAVLILPHHMATGSRADIYSDGNGSLAFSFGETGKYAVSSLSGRAATRRISIPTKYSADIPIGTTDAVLTSDGDMLVLDMSQFSDKISTE